MAMWLYKSEYCNQAIEILAQGKSLAAVCVAFGICRPTLYAWMAANPEFDSAVNRGKQAAQVLWEDMGQSGIAGDIKNFGASPWIFTMKNRFREDYAEVKEEKSVSDSLIEKLIEKLIE